MANNGEARKYREYAAEYDQQVHDYDSYAHDVLFGMCFEHVKQGERLLDLAIGTGLASKPFADIGLRISGLDISEDMLAACRNKEFTADLRQHDLTSQSLPYGDAEFDHVICCGAFHFFGELDGVFSEVRRIARPGSVFAFTTYPLQQGDGYGSEATDWGVDIYAHSPSYIAELLRRHGFEQLKQQRLLTKGFDKQTYSMQFSAHVCRIR